MRKSLAEVALTANVMPGDRETYLTSGMNDYIPKPFKIADLERSLKQFSDVNK